MKEHVRDSNLRVGDLLASGTRESRDTLKFFFTNPNSCAIDTRSSTKAACSPTARISSSAKW
jgi:hypothetical protein